MKWTTQPDCVNRVRAHIFLVSLTIRCRISSSFLDCHTTTRSDSSTLARSRCFHFLFLLLPVSLAIISSQLLVVCVGCVYVRECVGFVLVDIEVDIEVAHLGIPHILLHGWTGPATERTPITERGIVVIMSIPQWQVCWASSAAHHLAPHVL